MPIAPGTGATLKAFQDPFKRPPTFRDPPDDLSERRGHVFFLVGNVACKDSARCPKGTARGPPLWRLSEDLAGAFVLEEIVNVVRLGRLTALQMPSGGVRGAGTSSVASLQRPLRNSSPRWFRVPRHLFSALFHGRPWVHRTHTRGSPIDGIGVFDLALPSTSLAVQWQLIFLSLGGQQGHHPRDSSGRRWRAKFWV